MTEEAKKAIDYVEQWLSDSENAGMISNEEFSHNVRTVISLARRKELDRDKLLELINSWRNLDISEFTNVLADAICSRFCKPEFPEEEVRKLLKRFCLLFVDVDNLTTFLKDKWEGKDVGEKEIPDLTEPEMIEAMKTVIHAVKLENPKEIDWDWECANFAAAIVEARERKRKGDV